MCPSDSFLWGYSTAVLAFDHSVIFTCVFLLIFHWKRDSSHIHAWYVCWARHLFHWLSPLFLAVGEILVKVSRSKIKRRISNAPSRQHQFCLSKGYDARPGTLRTIGSFVSRGLSFLKTSRSCIFESQNITLFYTCTRSSVASLKSCWIADYKYTAVTPIRLRWISVTVFSCFFAPKSRPRSFS